MIPPQGEALSNMEIFRRLAARFGFTEPCFTATDAELMDDAIDPADLRLGGVRAEPAADRPRAGHDGRAASDAMLFTNVFPKTASGKVELASPYLEKKYGARLPSYRALESTYPLTLISPASDQRITSTFGGTTSNAGIPPLEMHPDDARARESRRTGSPCACGTSSARCACRCGSPTTSRAAWSRRSRARGSRRPTTSKPSRLWPPPPTRTSASGACYNDARVDVALAT